MKLDRIFSSHMVLQAHKDIVIYGTGAGTAQVSFAGITKTEMFSDETWSIKLPAMEYGGPYNMVICLNGNETVLEDIYIGDVYLFAGQSNMQFKMEDGAIPFDTDPDLPMLRLYSPDRMEKTDYYTAADGWVQCEKEHIKDWSALAYLCGRELVSRKGTAIGIVVAYQGASVIQSWLPKETVMEMGLFLPESEKEYTHYYGEYSSWNGDGVLYDYMISQIKPYPIAAIVWYQGESNSTPVAAEHYSKQLPAFIDIMRRDFCNPVLPFIIIQIADYTEGSAGWPMLQQVQAAVAKTVKDTYLVVSADVSDAAEIHPPKKDKLANRIVNTLLEIAMR